MLSRLKGVVRAHPKRIAFALVLLLVLAGVGLYVFALQQWSGAREAVENDRPAEARSRLKLCLFLWPRSVEVQLLAARAARLVGDFEAAEAHLNRCLRLHGGATGPVQLEFLLLRVQTGEVDEVSPALIDSVEKNHPDSPLILETLARHYMHHLNYQPAFACLSRWIEEVPDSAKAYHWRGWVQERMNSPKRAMHDYARALELNPDLYPVRLRVAEILLEDNDPLAALPHLERLMKTHPDRPHVLARLGQCRMFQAKHAEARKLLEAAVGELPNDLPLLTQLAKLEMQESRPAKAEHWLRRVLEVDPTDTEARYSLISALRLQGRTKEAEAALEQYEKYKEMVNRINRLLREVAEQPNTDPARASEIGVLLLRVGRDRLGLHWLHQALQRDPTHQPTHKALAEYYEKKGEREQAAAHRRRMDKEPKAKE